MLAGLALLGLGYVVSRASRKSRGRRGLSGLRRRKSRKRGRAKLGCGCGG